MTPSSEDEPVSSPEADWHNRRMSRAAPRKRFSLAYDNSLSFMKSKVRPMHPFSQNPYQKSQQSMREKRRNMLSPIENPLAGKLVQMTSAVHNMPVPNIRDSLRLQPHPLEGNPLECLPYFRKLSDEISQQDSVNSDARTLPLSQSNRFASESDLPYYGMVSYGTPFESAIDTPETVTANASEFYCKDSEVSSSQGGGGNDQDSGSERHEGVFGGRLGIRGSPLDRADELSLSHQIRETRLKSKSPNRSRTHTKKNKPIIETNASKVIPRLMDRRKSGFWSTSNRQIQKNHAVHLGPHLTPDLSAHLTPDLPVHHKLDTLSRLEESLGKIFFG